jgi:hypothetical protein
MSVDIGEYFIIQLKESVAALTKYNKITVLTALFQADSVMAYNVISKNSEMILTADSDQAAILGEECMCIKNFKINKKRQQICLDEFELFFANKCVLNKTLESIHLPIDSENIKNAKFPVFDEIGSSRVRALVAVAVGCDVNLTSVVTPSPMYKFLKSSFFTSISSDDDKYQALKNLLWQPGPTILKKN